MAESLTVDLPAGLNSHVLGRLLLLYVALISLAEVIFVYGGAVIGTAAHACILTVFLGEYAWMNRGQRVGSLPMSSHPRVATFLPALAVVPLLRILSVSMLAPSIPRIYWYALVGGPVLVGVAMAGRALDLSRADLGLAIPGHWLWQLVIGLTGIPLGFAAFRLFHPPRALVHGDWRYEVLAGCILFVFAGCTEEVLFRGLIQPQVTLVLGVSGVLVTSLLYSVMYLGSFSDRHVIFAWFIGMSFGWLSQRTRSVIGVSVAHGLLVTGLLQVWPLFKL